MSQTRDEILSQNAGALVCRRARSTQTLVTLYDSALARLDDDEGRGPYSTVCEPHGGVTSHSNKTTALAWLSHPEEWCPTCMGETGEDV